MSQKYPTDPNKTIMKTYTKEELEEIIEKHRLYLIGEPGGERANLSDSDLSDSDLSGANLSDSDLSGANLSYSNLSGSDLRHSSLRYSDLSGSDLSGANLRYSDLSGANLSYSNLRGSNLRHSSLRYSSLRHSDLSNADLRHSSLSNADLRRVLAGNGLQIKTLQLGRHAVTVSSDIICIGCQSHAPDAWRSFSDEEILEMDGKDGLNWWAEWKDVIFKVHATIKAD